MFVCTHSDIHAIVTAGLNLKTINVYRKMSNDARERQRSSQAIPHKYYIVYYVKNGTKIKLSIS